MPGMDGFETATLIRGRKKSAHTPIIFLTAFADEMHAARGYSLGAVDYILTPAVPDVLRTKVKVFVDLFRMARQVKRQADERVALAGEQAARASAEESTRRSAFLAEASKVLAARSNGGNKSFLRRLKLLPWVSHISPEAPLRSPAEQMTVVQGTPASLKRRASSTLWPHRWSP